MKNVAVNWQVEAEARGYSSWRELVGDRGKTYAEMLARDIEADYAEVSHV